MSNYLTPCSSAKSIKTKRDVILELYNNFKNEINDIIDVSYIFPKNDEIDLADLVFHISFILPQGCDVKTVVKVLIKDVATLKGISYTEQQVEQAIPIFQKFLDKYYTI